MGVAYRYRFGAVVYDEARFELVVGGHLVDIQRKPLQVLGLMLADAGQVVPRERFFQEVWRGQPTVDNVLANAVTKLRSALGPDHQSFIENIPRVGYRFIGKYERTAVGNLPETRLNLKPGATVQGREHFVLQHKLGETKANEVWLAQHLKTGESRVYKYSSDENHLSGLKREVTISRLLRNALGDRSDFVRIIDWNFEHAPYYLESEYGGQNLHDWALEDGRLAAMSAEQRLGIFLQIADAVSAAHSLAVLHKDLKPGNVLVAAAPPTTPGAASPWQCRLTDFGSGRLLDLAHIGELGITPLGLTMVPGIDSDAARGTLLYAAPELLADDPATVRSDIYALGVLLYQLLVGDLERGMNTGWERDIEDALLRADVARATDREPLRRFNSVGEMTEGLRGLAERHAAILSDESARLALAQNQRELERLRFRRPWMIGVIVSLALGLAASFFLYERTLAAQRELKRQLATSDGLNRFLNEQLITAANPAYTGVRNVSMADAALAAAAKIDSTLRESPAEVRAAVHESMQQAFKNLSKHKESIEQGELTLRELEKAGQMSPEAEARVRIEMITPLGRLGRISEAQQQQSIVESLLVKVPGPAETLRAKYWHAVGGTFGLEMKLDEQLKAEERAWQHASKFIASSQSGEADLADRVEVALSDAHNMLGHLKEAESHARDVLARQEARFGKQHSQACYSRVLLANNLTYQERLDEALSLAQSAVRCLEATLGNEDTRTASAQLVLAGVHYKAERFAIASVEFLKAATLFDSIQGPGKPASIVCRTNAANALRLGGQPEPAERALAETLQLAAANLKPDHPSLLSLRYKLATAKLDLGRTQGVAALLEDLTPEALGKSQIEVDWDARLLFQHARLALLTGQTDKGKAMLRDARKLQENRPEGQPMAAEIDGLLASGGKPTRSGTLAKTKQDSD